MSDTNDDERWPKNFQTQCEALEAFLDNEFKLESPWKVHVEAFEDDLAGGFRILEIAISSPNAGCSYMREDGSVHSMALILACEDFVRHFDPESHPPEGVNEDLSDFGYAKGILKKIIEETTSE